jgi:ketosteroid isomerase-like protein
MYRTMFCICILAAQAIWAQQKPSPNAKTMPVANPSALGCMKVNPQTIPQGTTLVKAETEFCLDVAKRGVDGWVEWFAENGSELQDKPVTGKTAIRDAMKGFLGTPGLVFYWYATKAEIFPSGDTGYTSGRYHFEYVGKDGKPTNEDGTYLTIWKKQKDGSWKVFADTGAADGKPIPPKAKLVPVVDKQ